MVWNQGSSSNGFRDIQWRICDARDRKGPLNKGQGHSFWYKSISRIRFPVNCSNFGSIGHTV